MRRSPLPALLRPVVVVLALGAVGITAGCTGEDGSPDGQDRLVASVSVVSVPVGELAGVDGALEIGQEIRVLIDTPDIDWEMTSSAPEVAEVIEDDPEANPRVVRIMASAAGDARVEATGSEEGARDSIDITVSAE